MNHRQLSEWAAYERIEPFETERGDARESLATWWMRQTWTEKHDARPSFYRLNLEGEEEKTEATLLMDEVKEMFSLG